MDERDDTKETLDWFYSTAMIAKSSWILARYSITSPVVPSVSLHLSQVCQQLHVILGSR
jgi:hypothetical protein